MKLASVTQHDGKLIDKDNSVGHAWRVDFKQGLGRTSIIVFGIAGVLIFIASWYVASKAAGNPRLFPSPFDVLTALYTLFFEREFHLDVIASVKRIFISFGIAVAVALPLGLLMGAFVQVRSVFTPIVSAGRYLPATAFVPLFLMWFGTGEEQKIALLTAGVFFFLVTLFVDNTMSVPTEYIEAAKTLGGNRKNIIWFVIIPHCLPIYIDTLRQMLAVSWTYLVVAEIVAATDGIGAMMMRAKRFVNVDDIMAGIFVIGVLGLTIDVLFRLLRKKLFPYLPAS